MSIATASTHASAIAQPIEVKNSTASATAGPEIDEAFVADGSSVVEGYAEPRGRYESVGYDDALASQLDAVLTRTAADGVEYARSFDEPPMLVLEDLNHRALSLADCVAERAELDCWLFSAVQERLTALAREGGVPVATTTEWATTKECHICGKHARVNDRTVKCRNERCPVENPDRDRSAAVTIAKRLG